MARTKRLSVWLMLVSTFSLLLPHNGFESIVCAQDTTAGEQYASRSSSDVALNSRDQLFGRVVSAQGQPTSQTAVQLFQNNRLVASARTNLDGNFQTGPIAGGTYLLVTGNQKLTIRAWTSNTAPPAATPNVLIAESTVIRGQCCYSNCQVTNCDGTCGNGAYCGGGVGMLIHPMVIGAAIAAAIVIPLALDDDDEPPPALDNSNAS